MSYTVSAVIQKDDFGCYACCPELEKCHSRGEYFEKVLSSIREAIEHYLSTLPEEERRQHLSREILTAPLEANLAKLPRLTAHEAGPIL